MFEPDVEARFKRIEDAHIVAAALLDRFERKTEERFEQLEALFVRFMEVQDRRHAEQDRHNAETDRRINALIDAQIRGQQETAELRQETAELREILKRYLEARGDGNLN